MARPRRFPGELGIAVQTAGRLGGDELERSRREVRLAPHSGELRWNHPVSSTGVVVSSAEETRSLGREVPMRRDGRAVTVALWVNVW
ncbi:hypothetical protein GCM10010156_49940 [Planobispora rosea]|uniref:Uncharacterized protein n=1 Tax=Planobispora rosea TaxID=35762 RepID=A0A8J3RY83_PLARO|nr:hypothetical protein GCM10010156_49940 [Planobispora rosea]GIH83399.1 hypothetical protein Pro02_18070 [Planobispora rosea]